VTYGAQRMDELILDVYSILVGGMVCAGVLLLLSALWRYLYRSLIRTQKLKQ